MSQANINSNDLEKFANSSDLWLEFKLTFQT